MYEHQITDDWKSTIFSDPKKCTMFCNNGCLKVQMELQKELNKDYIVEAKFRESVMTWGGIFSKRETEYLRFAQGKSIN